MASSPVKTSSASASGTSPGRPAGHLRRALASDFVYDFTRSPIAIIAGLVVLFLFLVAIFAPLVAPTNPFDPASLNLMNGFTPPMEANMF
ncbi:MAG: ABC transporter permease, partial [Candidatus Puniceispirillaceae bacterium]